MAGRGMEILEIPQYSTTRFITINELQKPEAGKKDTVKHNHKK